MPSVYKRNAALPAVPVPDWALIDRLIEAYEKHGSVYLRAGNELLASPEELKSAIESVSEAPESIDVLLKRGTHRSVDYVDATARLSSLADGSTFAVVSVEESIVDQLLTRTTELLEAAAAQDPALTPRKNPSKFRRFARDHGAGVVKAIIVTVVGGLILAAILSLT